MDIIRKFNTNIYSFALGYFPTKTRKLCLFCSEISRSISKIFTYGKFLLFYFLFVKKKKISQALIFRTNIL